MQRPTQFLLLATLALAVAGVHPLQAQPPEGAATAEAAATPAVPIDSFRFSYGQAHPSLPAVEALSSLAVPLVQQNGVWTTGQGIGGGSFTLGSVPAGSRFDASALRLIAEEIVQHYNDQGIFGVWVVLDGIEGMRAANPSEVAATRLLDSRAPNDRSLHIVVWLSQVAQLRTLARGDRFAAAVASNHPKHAWIAQRSPLQPPASPDQPGSLLLRDTLENYLQMLSQQPNRRVEASVASAGEPGKVVLDYLVTESKPWQVFAQVSNTGTKSTDEWRTRLGYQHHQLTNHDDTLNFDFVSTPNLDTKAGFLSYRIPLGRPSRFAVRTYGSYGDFTADGEVFESLRFVGDNWMIGSEVTYQTTLARIWDVTLNAGANYSSYAINTNIGELSLYRGNSPFLVPFLGGTIGHDHQWWALKGGLRVEHSVSGVPNTDPGNGVDWLGRTNVDESWTALRWSFESSMFLEPLFLRGSQGSLAHEISLRARGRWTLGGERLIPQEQDLLGGAFTVRGYPESVVPADDTVVVNAEYAFHVARALKAGDAGRLFGRPFRWRPSPQTRRADWDLTLRAFFDYGYRGVNPDPEATPSASSSSDGSDLGDRDLSLYSAGGGAELLVWQNFSLRCDVGVALSGIKDGDKTLAKEGSVRTHVSASFYW